MRIVFEAALFALALFAAWELVTLNDQYMAMVAEVKDPTGYCNVSFGSSTATMECNRISRLDEK